MSAQTEVRYDALSDRSVIVATGRDARPHQFRAPIADPDRGTEDCPFCPGHEQLTPPEVARTGSGAPDATGWRVRVVPNLFPIVDAHEVVVLSPDHSRPLGALGETAAIDVFAMLRDRVATHLSAGRAATVAILNHGRQAGASLPHPHAQVLATDFVPPAIAAAAERAQRVNSDLVLADASCDESLVLTREPALAWCPYSSSSPFQVRVTHETAGAHFDGASHDGLAAVAVATRDALAKLSRALDDPPYNLVVHSAPPSADRFHWYVEITPRLSVLAGFEQATGLFVNTVDPARAAHTLREVRS